jgi:signal transduction histidine kinase
MENMIEEQKAIAELEQEKRKNHIIRQLSLELSKPASLKEKLDNILAVLDHDLGLNHTMLFLPDPDGLRLKVFASRGFTEKGIGAEVNMGQGIIGVVALRKRKLRMSNISRSRTYIKIATENQEDHTAFSVPGLPDAESQVALPLLVNEELIAVLSAESPDFNFFSQEDEDFLMTLSQLMAHSIQNAMIMEQLEQKVQERTAALAEQKLMLEKANASKDHLFTIIGHDLRSPVASLQNVAALIEYHHKKGNTQYLSELGGKIVKAAKNMNCMLDNLLNWSITQTGDIKIQPEKIHLPELVKEVNELYTDIALAKQITIHLEVSSDMVLFADRNATLTILRNLLSNALKFTHPGGNITIRTDGKENFAQISITDDGVGILSENIPFLFELKENKSTRGTAKEKGVGLGLVLVKELVQLNNGHISVASQPGKGATVSFTLPLYSSSVS